MKFYGRLKHRIFTNNTTISYLKYSFGEIILIGLGLLLALQINNWSVERNNRERENVFINQLTLDLRESEGDLEKIEQFHLERAKASVRILHSFWLPELQQADSSLFDLIMVRSNKRYSPVLGTVQTLINSGNIDLIQSAKLRAAIISYDEKVKTMITDIVRFEETYYRQGVSELDKQYDWNSIVGHYFKDSILERNLSKSEDGLALSPIPKIYKKVPFPISVEEIYSNKLIYMSYYKIYIAHGNAMSQYQKISEATNDLLNIIKTEYNLKR